MIQKTSVPAVERKCQNCGSPMLGDHCYACGQPVKGLVRHFSSIAGDILDTVFSLDSRTPRTLLPLLLRPGYLTLEYFAGHRVRFVSPVRLFMFIAIFAFLALKLIADPEIHGSGAGIFVATNSTSEVEAIRDQTLAKLQEPRSPSEDPEFVMVGGVRVRIDGDAADLEIATDRIRRLAQERIDWLAARDAALAAGRAVPVEPVERAQLQFGDAPWDLEKNPVVIDWLPVFANRWLNALISRTQDNVTKVRANPRLLIDTFMQTLPQTLFVLLPIFALILKAAFLLKRRLYMEHLIVALHSHAFLCLALLIEVGLAALRDWLGAGVLHDTSIWGSVLLGLWVPMYLLLMHKWVYQQGWIMTLIKFGAIGVLYVMLISFGVVANILVNLVSM